MKMPSSEHCKHKQDAQVLGKMPPIFVDMTTSHPYYCFSAEKYIAGLHPGKRQGFRPARHCWNSSYCQQAVCFHNGRRWGGDSILLTFYYCYYYFSCYYLMTTIFITIFLSIITSISTKVVTSTSGVPALPRAGGFRIKSYT